MGLEKMKLVWFIGAGLFVSLNLLHAQTQSSGQAASAEA
jgi:hypothetical protein